MKTTKSRTATVSVRNGNRQEKVRITSKLKPQVPSEIIQKWQSLLDVSAKVINVPVALIMQLHEKHIEVFLKSNTPGNPYKSGEKAELVYGLYCETVIGTQEMLLLPDARKDPLWNKNNPDIDLNMISYLGFPLNWPDGEVFGTVCLLDSKKNTYGKDTVELFGKIRDIIESDLEKMLDDQIKELKSRDLAERVKELTCLFALSHLKERQELSQNEFFQAAVEIIPPAFQFSGDCCARIRCCGNTYTSKGFRESPWKQEALIPAGTDTAGSIEVFYLKDLLSEDGGPFLKEEKDLLESLAINIGLYLERTSAEDALKRSRENLRTILNSIGDAVIATDTAGRITGMNPVAESLTGWKAKDALGSLFEDVFRVVHTGTGKPAANPVEKVLKTGRVEGLARHTKLISKNGEEYQIDDSGAPIRDEQGNISGVVMVFRDITSSYQAQKQLFESEARFRELFENMSTCVAVYRPLGNGDDFEIVGFNKAAEKIEKIDREKVLGKKVTEVFPGVIDMGLFNVLRHVWETGDPQNFPITLYRDERVSGWRVNYIYKLPSGDIVALYDDLTEKKIADEVLKTNYSLLRIAGECAHFGGWSVDLANNLCTWSDAVADIHEVPRGYAPPVEDGIAFYAPEWREKIIRVFRDCAEKGISYDEEMEILTKKGKRKWVRTVGHPVRDENGRIIKVQGAFQDISQQKQAEETYRNLFQNAQVGLFRTRVEDGKILESNEKLAQMFGYENREDFIGNYLTSENYADPGTREKMLKKIRETGKVQNFEARFKRKDGSLFWAQYTARIMKDEGWIEGVAEDITVRKNTEERLAHSHELLRYIIEHANSAVAVHDRDMRYIYVSQQYLDQYKIKEKNIIGKHHYDVFPDLPQRWRDIHQKVLKGEIFSADRDPYCRDDGSVEWTRWECRPWYENDGSIGGLIVYTAVITDDVLREQALKESEEKYRLIVENANDGIEITQQDKIIFANKRFSDMLGYTADEVKDIPFSRIFTEKAIFELKERETKRRKGETKTHHYETTFRKKDGSVINVSVNYDIIDFKGKPATFAIVRDITEQKQADELLKASEEKYRHLFESMDQGVVYQNAKGEIISVNPAAEHILGLSLDQMRSKTSHDPSWKAVDKDKNTLPGKDHPAIVALRTGEKVVNFLQGIYNPKNKDYIWIMVNSTPLFDKGMNKPYGVYSTFLDITDLIQTEKELETSENKLKSLFENMTEGFALHKIITNSAGEPVDYVFLEVNPAFERLTGLLKENIIGKAVTKVLPGIEKDPADWIGKYGGVALNNTTLVFEDYSESLGKWYIISAFSPQKDLFATTIIDVTEKKLSEIKMREMADFLSLAYNAAHLGIWKHDILSGIITFDEKAREYYGTESTTISIDALMKCIHPRDLQRLNEEMAKVINPEHNGNFTTEYRVIHADKSVHWLEVNTRINFEGTGPSKKPVLGFGTVLDISERKRSEIELLNLKNELELQVEEQTRELKEKLNELERFREATINREFRMKELRDEIDLLKAQLSKG
ncbi:MAG: PAS domain S-box protein [Candidatus Marinimicrobia bacterium]|nr:PAS domain S-box protein [Candidatus Neomarinimicrobiota bacterium]